jgi:hypothetical protein
MVSSTVYSIFLWHQKLLARGRDAADLSRKQALAGDFSDWHLAHGQGHGLCPFKG